MSQPSENGTTKLTENELNRIAKLIYNIAGIVLQTEKVSLVQARLSKRLRVLGLSSFSQYCDLLESSDGKQEQTELLSALTTNVTKFFREGHHFDFLKKEVFQNLLKKAQKGERIRFWSAGCSSGEEPYSIAMSIYHHCPDLVKKDLKILATDIDPKILTAAKSGRYNLGSSASIPDDFKKKYFSADSGDGMVTVDPKIRSMVTFNELNLHSNWPMKFKFDVIFCRNVIIYFNKVDEAKIWKKFASVLKPDGNLFIGHSERIPVDLNTGLNLSGVTTYSHSAGSQKLPSGKVA